MWNLSKKDKTFLDRINNISQEHLDMIPNEDDKAVYFSDGTEEEYQKYVREEINGWKKFDKAIEDLLGK